MKRTTIKIISIFTVLLSAFFLSSCSCEHEYDEGSITTQPTCTVNGVRTFTCGKCGETSTTEIEKIPHDYDDGKISEKPTCIAEGTKVFTCKVCGDTREEKIEKTSHSYDNGKVTKQATCTEEGIKTYTCTICNATKEEKIPCVSHDYEEKITKQPTFEETGVKTFTCKNCKKQYTEDIPKLEATVVVTATGKTNIPEDIYNGRYSDRVEFSFDLENQYDKEVKGVSGTLEINDLFGKKIMSVNCDFTGKSIPAKGKISYSGLGIDINQFMDNHIKLYNTAFDDLKISYKVSKIIFSDTANNNQNEDNSNTLKQNPQVVVTVTGKNNIPEDIYNGRYSPFIEFTFNLRNTTNKDIKGVDGILTINDLFGKKILSMRCDFTGQIIPANSSIVVTGTGLEVNEFMDTHVKLYNENLNDLQFEYSIDTIVYIDGTSEKGN